MHVLLLFVEKCGIKVNIIILRVAFFCDLGIVGEMWRRPDSPDSPGRHRWTGLSHVVRVSPGVNRVPPRMALRKLSGYSGQHRAAAAVAFVATSALLWCHCKVGKRRRRTTKLHPSSPSLPYFVTVLSVRRISSSDRLTHSDVPYTYREENTSAFLHVHYAPPSTG